MRSSNTRKYFPDLMKRNPIQKQKWKIEKSIMTSSTSKPFKWPQILKKKNKKIKKILDKEYNARQRNQSSKYKQQRPYEFFKPKNIYELFIKTLLIMFEKIKFKRDVGDSGWGNWLYNYNINKQLNSSKSKKKKKKNPQTNEEDVKLQDFF